MHENTFDFRFVKFPCVTLINELLYVEKQQNKNPAHSYIIQVKRSKVRKMIKCESFHIYLANVTEFITACSISHDV